MIVVEVNRGWTSVATPDTPVCFITGSSLPGNCFAEGEMKAD